MQELHLLLSLSACLFNADFSFRSSHVTKYQSMSVFYSSTVMMFKDGYLIEFNSSHQYQAQTSVDSWKNTCLSCCTWAYKTIGTAQIFIFPICRPWNNWQRGGKEAKRWRKIEIYSHHLSPWIKLCLKQDLLEFQLKKLIHLFFPLSICLGHISFWIRVPIDIWKMLQISFYI